MTHVCFHVRSLPRQQMIASHNEQTQNFQVHNKQNQIDVSQSEWFVPSQFEAFETEWSETLFFTLINVYEIYTAAAAAVVRQCDAGRVAIVNACCSWACFSYFISLSHTAVLYLLWMDEWNAARDLIKTYVKQLCRDKLFEIKWDLNSYSLLLANGKIPPNPTHTLNDEEP